MEGNARFALSSYLRFVTLRRLLYRELHPASVARGVRHEVRDYAYSPIVGDLQHNAWILSCAPERSRFSGREEIDTLSNLSSEVFAQLTAELGPSSTDFETKAHLIDHSLLRARNQIARGRYHEVSASSYSDLHDEVMTLLGRFRSLVSTSAEAKAYTR